MSPLAGTVLSVQASAFASGCVRQLCRSSGSAKNRPLRCRTRSALACAKLQVFAFFAKNAPLVLGCLGMPSVLQDSPASSFCDFYAGTRALPTRSRLYEYKLVAHRARENRLEPSAVALCGSYSPHLES